MSGTKTPAGSVRTTPAAPQSELIPYHIIRSGRRTLCIEVNADGAVLVRAPYLTGSAEIQRFVASRQDWILRSKALIRERRQAEDAFAVPPIPPADVRALAARALREIPPRTARYAALLHVTYGRITIRNQTTLWGSCSARGSLSFNCLLMLMDQRIIDYVIVHELCHRLEMNHSARFWAEVERILPDYRERRQWLKDHGGAYIRAMKEGALKNLPSSDDIQQ